MGKLAIKRRTFLKGLGAFLVAPVVFLKASVSKASIPWAKGRVFWVNSGTNLPQLGTEEKPFKTIQAALNSCQNGRGDSIYVLPNHSEDTLTINKSNVSIIGSYSNSCFWRT